MENMLVQTLSLILIGGSFICDKAKPYKQRFQVKNNRLDQDKYSLSNLRLDQPNIKIKLKINKDK